MQKIAADGVTNTVYSATDSTEINTGYPIYFFTCNQTGTPTWFGRTRTYGFKLWQGGELVRDFRPCLEIWAGTVPVGSSPSDLDTKLAT